MPEPLITVSIERKHNLGNYEHVTGKVEIAVIGTGDVESTIRGAQDLIRPYLTVEALTRGSPVGVTVQGSVETNVPPADEPKAEKPKATRTKGRTAEEARPAEPAAAVAAAKAAPTDPTDPAAIRQRITDLCGDKPDVAAAVRRHLAANDFAKLRQVPDEQLGEYLAVAEGREPEAAKSAADDDVI